MRTFKLSLSFLACVSILVSTLYFLRPWTEFGGIEAKFVEIRICHIEIKNNPAADESLIAVDLMCITSELSNSLLKENHNVYQQ
jgi:hypothetical protein